MNTKLDCAADGERAMDMQAKTQCLGLFLPNRFCSTFSRTAATRAAINFRAAAVYE